MLSPLPESQRQELSKWLHLNEAGNLKRCIKHRIADLMAQAANAPLEDPIKLLLDKNLGAFDEPLMEAAKYQVFLTVFNEVSDPNFAFLTTTLTVKDD